MVRPAVERPPIIRGGPPVPMTYEEWLEIEGENLYSEWVDGEGWFYVSNSDRHQAISAFLHMLLSFFVHRFRLGIVRYSPFEVKLERSAREPDLLFLSNQNLHRLSPMRILGPVDLAVELISDDSPSRDRIDKRREYQEAGVGEYWLVDARLRPEPPVFLRIGADGVYQPVPLDAEGRFRSHVIPGFWLDPAWLLQDPLPDPLVILDQLLPGR